MGRIKIGTAPLVFANVHFLTRRCTGFVEQRLECGEHRLVIVFRIVLDLRCGTLAEFRA